MCRGMAVWMEAWSHCSEVNGVERVRGRNKKVNCDSCKNNSIAWPEGLHAEVAELLAGIAWTVVRN